MNIALEPMQQKWLDEQVASGIFLSVDEAIALAVAGLMTTPEDENLDWARLSVDEARSAIARGEGVPALVVKAEIAEQLRKLAAK